MGENVNNATISTYIEMKVIILAGGRATRLPRSAANIPKALVPVGGRPILSHLVDGLLAAGLSDIRLALGFRAEQIISYLREQGYPCEHVVEPELLGTGGAVKFAARDLEGPFMVLNGDILVNFDYPEIMRAHQPGSALLVSCWQDDNRDYGFLRIEDDRIAEFLEKPAEPRSGLVSAGCSILEPEQVQEVPQDVFMLETEVYPRLAREGRLKTIRHPGSFVDIGTEERLARVRGSLPV